MTSTSLQVYDQTIIGQLHAAWQSRACLSVAEIVGDVSEVRALDAETRRDRDRFADAEVRRVGPLPERVEDDRGHAVEERPRRVRAAIAVREVCEGADTESEHGQN